VIEIVDRKATFSPDRVYRYDLTRRLRLEEPTRAGAVAFVLLNPSTADATKEDPTVRRCIAYAAQWRSPTCGLAHLSGVGPQGLALHARGPRHAHARAPGAGPDSPAMIRPNESSRISVGRRGPPERVGDGGAPAPQKECP